MNHRRAIGALAVILLVAACGGDDDGAATTTGAAPGTTTAAPGTTAAADTTAAPGTTTAAPDTTAATGCPPEVAELVESGTAPLSIEIDGTVDMSAHAGKKLWHIAPSFGTGYALVVAETVEEAATVAGFDVTVWDGQGQPNVMAEGIAQAVADGADAIVIHSINPEAVGEQLGEAAAAGIPVVSVLNALDPAALPEGITAVYDPDVDALSRQIAAYSLADSGCTANAAVFYSSVFPILDQMNTVIADAYAEWCATCPIGEQNLDLRTMSQELPGQTQNLLRSEPELTHLLATFDSAALFVVQGVDELGADVRVVGANGNDANLDIIRAGGSQIASVAYPPGTYAAWQIVDQVGHILAGDDAAVRTLPIQTIDASNVGTDNSLEQVWPGLVGFEDAFRDAWGVD